MATNPNGANQFLLDPRQKLFWELYNKYGSETFSNAYQAALKAGYTEASATQITTQQWFIEMARNKRVDKAEKKLDEILNLPSITEDNKIDSQVLRIQADVGKFMLETQGKERGYTKQTENKNLNLNIDVDVKNIDEFKNLAELLNKQFKNGDSKEIHS